MGVSRIYLSVHYATDVLGGVLTGSIGGFAGYAISNRIPESFYTADFRDYIDKLKAKRSGGKGARPERRGSCSGRTERRPPPHPCDRRGELLHDGRPVPRVQPSL